MHFILSYSRMSHSKSRLLTSCFLICSAVFCVCTLCSDHGEKGHDYRTFLHVLLQTFHFPVSTGAFLNFDQPSPRSEVSLRQPLLALTARGLDLPACRLSRASPGPPPLPCSLSSCLSNSRLPFDSAVPSSESCLPLYLRCSRYLSHSLSIFDFRHSARPARDAKKTFVLCFHIQSHSPSSWIAPLAAVYFFLRGCTLNFYFVGFF